MCSSTAWPRWPLVVFLLAGCVRQGGEDRAGEARSGGAEHAPTEQRRPEVAKKREEEVARSSSNDAPGRAKRDVPRVTNEGFPASGCRPIAVDGERVVVGTNRRTIRLFEGPRRWSLVAETATEPCGLFLIGDSVYWTELGDLDAEFRNGRVMSAELSTKKAEEVAGSQYNPTDLVAGQSGVFWFECGTGRLWRMAEDRRVEVIAQVPSDASGYAHGCPGRGLAAENGVLAWVHRTGPFENLRLFYAREDGTEFGEVEFDYNRLGGRDLALVGGDAYLSLSRSIGADDAEPNVVVRVDLESGATKVVWRGLAIFVGSRGSSVLWAEYGGRLFTARGGRSRLVGRLEQRLKPTRYLFSDGSLIWSNGTEVVRSRVR